MEVEREREREKEKKKKRKKRRSVRANIGAMGESSAFVRLVDTAKP